MWDVWPTMSFVVVVLMRDAWPPMRFVCKVC